MAIRPQRASEVATPQMDDPGSAAALPLAASAYAGQEYGHQAYANAYANYNGYNDGEEEEEYPDDGAAAASSRRREVAPCAVRRSPIRWDTELYESDVCVTRAQVEQAINARGRDRGENDGFGSWERGGVCCCVCVCVPWLSERSMRGLSSDFQER